VLIVGDSMYFLNIISGSFLFIVVQSAFAERFNNQFIEFETPANWRCRLEGAEWICQNSAIVKEKEALIVLAAKLKGEQDSIDQYLTHLKAPKMFPNSEGRFVKSDMKYAKTVNLNGQVWVDALHLESELKGYYTRYLATVKQDIGVLLTYSVRKDLYQIYNTQFDNVIRTLKVFRKAGGINVVPNSSNSSTIVPPLPQGDSVFSQKQTLPDFSDSNKSETKSKNSPLVWLALIIAIVVSFILIRRRKN
jgi:hypothetical protein